MSPKTPVYARPRAADVPVDAKTIGARRRGSSTQQGYGAAWRKLRKQVLAEEPACRQCGEPSTDVDHITPRRPGGSDERTNLQALCHACHSRKTAAMDGCFGNQDWVDSQSVTPVVEVNTTPAALVVEQVPIDQLRPDPANPRRISNDLLHWQELRAIELAWQEIAAEFDGQDPRHPDPLRLAEETRARLLELLGHLSPRHARKPPEPSETVMASVRRHVDEAMRPMGFRELP